MLCPTISHYKYFAKVTPMPHFEENAVFFFFFNLAGPLSMLELVMRIQHNTENAFRSLRLSARHTNIPYADMTKILERQKKKI